MSDDEESIDDVIRFSLWREAEFGEQPRHGLEEIQARLRAEACEPAEPPVRPWLRTTIGAAVIGTAATIGLFTILPDAFQPKPGPESAAESTGPAAESAGPAVAGKSASQADPTVVKPAGRQFPLYWLGYQPGEKEPRLYRTVETFTGLTAVHAVRRLTERAPDPDYFSGWAGARVNSVSEINGVIVVDFESLPKVVQDAALADAAIQQLVHTVHGAFAEPLPVRITVGGKAFVAVPAVAEAKPVPVGKLVAPIWITSPAQGASTSTAVKITGLAITFEGNVSYRIRNTRTGKVVARNAVTVHSGDNPAEQRPFVISARLPPGSYEVECVEYSALDGRLTTRDTKSFTVR
ncbi:Gmad2 immunoglobulin-like domain-containing protein [Kribbella deserti]|uniref:Gmad2 immunoglobulin-like domain-containing protein n=1 Tax=Kribbella deserti TaxID=1926257 RepID=A0ABV6QEL1_9ACTN